MQIPYLSWVYLVLLVNGNQLSSTAITALSFSVPFFSLGRRVGTRVDDWLERVGIVKLLSSFS